MNKFCEFSDARWIFVAQYPNKSSALNIAALSLRTFEKSSLLWFSNLGQYIRKCEGLHFTHMRKHLHDHIISLRHEIWVHKSRSNQPLFIESEQSCVCVLC